MASRGAPIGNTNGSKGRLFYEALRRELALNDWARLRKAASKLADAAANGEPWAVAEVANRIDGKPAQSVALTDGDGGPLKILAEVSFANADDKNRAA